MMILNRKNHDNKTNTWVPIGVQSLTLEYIGNVFQNFLYKNYSAKICDITIQASLRGVRSMFYIKYNGEMFKST